MKIAIFGAGNAGQYLYEQIISESNNIVVEAFLDNFSEFNEVNGIKVFTPDTFFSKNMVDAVFLAAGAQRSLLEMIKKVRGYGIHEIYMLHDIAGKNKLPLFEKGELISTKVRKIRFSSEKPTLPYFEMPIIDLCNLNCKGCLFGVNQNGEVEYTSLNEIKRDFARMAELFEDIPWMRILGGEPLMHPDLSEVLDFARQTFPNAEIDVCTNGLLVPKLSDDILNSFFRNKITVHISGYKPTCKILDKIEKKLSDFDLYYTILKRNEFYKYYTTTENNYSEDIHEKCPSSGCRELYRGRLAKCSAALAFERLNKQFSTNYDVRRNIDWFDIYDSQISAWDIIEGLDKIVPICRYCDIKNMKFFKWSNGEKEKLDDYVLK